MAGANVVVPFTFHNPVPSMVLEVPVPEAFAAHATACSPMIEEWSKNPKFNFGKFIAAAIQLFIAFTTNPAGIPAAIAALIAAITGA